MNKEEEMIKRNINYIIESKLKYLQNYKFVGISGERGFKYPFYMLYFRYLKFRKEGIGFSKFLLDTEYCGVFYKE